MISNEAYNSMTEAEKAAVDAAETIGKEHGVNAASWVFNGDTSRETYVRYRKGIEDCDGEVMDALPEPDLSGQWADGYSTNDLLKDVGLDPETVFEWLKDHVCEAYEEAYRVASLDEINRMISVQLD